VGAGTLFLSELGVGNRILVQGESNSRTIVAIASDTSLTVDSVFYTTASGLSAAAVPSAVRVDDSGGDPQILVTDDGRVGVGTLTPNGQMEVGGTGAGDLDGCPIGLNIHMQPDADPWPLVMSTDVGGVPNGFAIWVTQMGGGTTLTFSVFEGDNVTVQDFVSLDADGFHLANAQFTAQPTSISGAYAVQAPDYHLLADAGTVITLPAATDAPGRVLNIVKTADGAPVSVAPASGDTINGSATAQIIGPTFSGLLLYTDGGNWFATSLPVASTPVTVTANYQILESDQYVLADAGSAGIVVALPAVANSTGQVITIIKTAGAGTVSVSPQPGETINGGPSEQTIGPLFSGLLLYGAGTTWTATRLPAASSPVHVTVDYTITPTDRIVYVDAAAGAVAVTLPTFNENSGRVLRIIKVDATANEVTLTPASGETINGAASKMITTPYSGIQLTALPEATTWLGIVLSAA
jgi:hypothetical protein